MTFGDMLLLTAFVFLVAGICTLTVGYVLAAVVFSFATALVYSFKGC